MKTRVNKIGTATFSLLVLNACGASYEVGSNHEAQGGAAETNTGGTPGTTGAPGPVQLLFPCDRWGEGTSLNYDVGGKAHFLNELGGALWGNNSGDDLSLNAGQAAAEAYGPHLSTSGDVYCIVRHMLTDARAANSLRVFYRQWLNVDNLPTPDAELFPTYTDARMQLLATRAVDFAVSQTLGGPADVGDFGGSARLVDLMQGARPLEMAPGWPGPQPERPDLSQFNGAGLLSEPAVITHAGNHSGSPHVTTVGTAVHIMETFLCKPLPPAPADIDITLPPDPEPSATYVEQYQIATQSDASCATCHRLFDSFGLVLDRFDAVGRLHFVDRVGQFYPATAPDLWPMHDGTVLNSVVSAGQYIGTHDDFKSCYATRMARYLNNELVRDERGWLVEGMEPTSDEGEALVSALPDTDVIPELIAATVQHLAETGQFATVP